MYRGELAVHVFTPPYPAQVESACIARFTCTIGTVVRMLVYYLLAGSYELYVHISFISRGDVSLFLIL